MSDSTLYYSAEGFWPRWERLTSPVTAELMLDAGLQPGERVVDIGCGSGLATFAAAAAVGETGEVVAFDLSADSLAVVEEAARVKGMPWVLTAHGDMERDDIEGAPFDAAVNQFGLTFATDLVSTFSRIRAQLRPGGRCVFAAWAEAERNPLLPGPLTARYRSSAPVQYPFAMAGVDQTLEMLSLAGFARTSSRLVELTNRVPLGVVFQDSMLTGIGLTGDPLERARTEVLDQLGKHADGGGEYAVPLVFSIYSAVNG